MAISRYYDSSVSILKGLILPAGIATTGYYSYQAIQVARELGASPLKDKIKDNISHVQSTFNAFVISHEGYQALTTVFDPNIWSKLKLADRLAVLGLMAVGTGGAGYAMYMFGIESNTLAASLSAGAGALFFNIATITAKFRAVKNEHAREDDYTVLDADPVEKEKSMAFGRRIERK